MATWPTLSAQPAVGSAAQASQMSTVIQALLVPGSATNAYTPVWTATTTNPTVGNGSLTGNYWQVGKLVLGSWRLVLGSTTSIGTGTYSFSLPVASAVRYGTEDALGVGMYRHQGTATRYHQTMYWSNATTIIPLYMTASATLVALSSAAPVAPASTDIITGQFMYESL